MLEQDGVADDEVRSGEPRHLVVRIVPGHDPEQDADGAPADERRPLAVGQRDRLVGEERSRPRWRSTRRSRQQKSTSPSACSTGFPISRTMISASSSRRSVCSSPTRRTSAARSSVVVARDHSRWARSAAAIASASAASLMVGYSSTRSPVAGLVTAYSLTFVLPLASSPAPRRAGSVYG